MRERGAADEAMSATALFIELAWNEGRLDDARELLDPTFLNHNPIAGDETRDAFLARIAATRDAFPDWRMDVEEMLASGDRVITRWSATATHRGTFRGLAPTGRRVRTSGIAIDRVVGGRRVEGWAMMDVWGLARQLGGTLPW